LSYPPLIDLLFQSGLLYLVCFVFVFVSIYTASTADIHTGHKKFFISIPGAKVSPPAKASAGQTKWPNLAPFYAPFDYS